MNAKPAHLIADPSVGLAVHLSVSRAGEQALLLDLLTRAKCTRWGCLKLRELCREHHKPVLGHREALHARVLEPLSLPQGKAATICFPPLWVCPS